MSFDAEVKKRKSDGWWQWWWNKNFGAISVQIKLLLYAVRSDNNFPLGVTVDTRGWYDRMTAHSQCWAWGQLLKHSPMHKALMYA